MIKIIFHDIGFIPYRPSFKCGADPISAGIMGASGLVGSVITSSSSASNVNSQLAAQSRENQINRDWQTAEAEKARQYNTLERLSAQDWSKQMLDYMNAYNSPAHQAALYRQGGFNPSLALGGQGAIVSANPGAGSPQTSPTPSGVGGLSPVGFQPLDLQIPQLLNGVGSFFKDIGEAEKLGVDTDYAKASFNMNLKALSADASAKEFLAAGYELDNAIKQGVKDSTIKKAFFDCEKAHWDALLSQEQGLSEELKQEVLDSQRKLNDALADYHGQNAELLKLDCKTYMDKFNLAFNIGKSQIASNYATAANQTSQATQNEIFNKIYSDKRYRHSLITQAVEVGRQAVQNSSISKSQAEHMRYLVEQAAYANDMKEFTYWSGQVNQFVNTLGSAASQFYGAGALRELINLRKGQQVSPVSVQGFK